MTEIAWDQLYQLCQQWQQTQESAAGGQRHEQGEGDLAKEYTALLAFVARAEAPPALTETPVLATALCWFMVGNGSRGANEIPVAALQAAWQALRPIIQAASPLHTSEQAFDLVVAWGCGWRGSLAGDSDQPQRRLAAILALRTLVERSVHHTLKQVAQWVLGHDNLAQLLNVTTAAEVKALQRSYAQKITLELMHGRCHCGKQPQKGAVNQEDHCGRREHALGYWDSNTCSLAAFVAQAVRGSAQPTLQAGMFATSMLYPLLHEDLGLCVDTVEFKVCQGCGTSYEGSRCRNPACTHPAFTSGQTRCIARKNRLLIPYEWGGRYQMMTRWRCRNPACGSDGEEGNHLFAHHLTTCPLCGGKRSQRPTSIWVYWGADDKRTRAESDE